MGSKNRGIILVTDGWPAANMAGISQTLFNLLDNYPGKLWMLMPEKEPLPTGPGLIMTQVSFPAGPYKLISNRFGRWLNAGQVRRQLSWRQRKWKTPQGLPGIHEAIVIVSTTDPVKLQVAWLLLQQGYTTLPYFMDDWLSGNSLSWKGNSIQTIAKDLLNEAPAWLMISEPLKLTLKERYGLKERPYLIIHNPSPPIPQGAGYLQETGITEEKKNPLAANGYGTLSIKNRIDELSIIYAGSIWPMHADALIAVAKAVNTLQEKMKCSLTIYTSTTAWEQNKNQLGGQGIIYGGFIPYREIHAKLGKANLLLVTASFLDQYQPFSRGSVQTKLTDYMAVGRPVVYVGPPDGASGSFVHQWDCGYTIGTSNPADIAAQLMAIAAMPHANLRKAKNGLQAAKGYFNKATVQQRLYDFLEKFSVIEEKALCQHEKGR